MKIFSQKVGFLAKKNSVVIEGEITSPPFIIKIRGETVKPITDKWHSIESFDCYAKKIIKFTARSRYRSGKKRLESEVCFSELTKDELLSLATTDYYSVFDDSFDVGDWEIKVKNFDIANALRELPLNKREIILLYYFIGMTDKEVAECLAIPVSTAHNRRVKTLKKLREILEDSNYV